MVGYRSSTTSGMSGGPVINTHTGTVIALHCGSDVPGVSNIGYPIRDDFLLNMLPLVHSSGKQEILARLGLL